MNASWMPPGPAQADLARLSGLEGDLMDRAALVGVVYGVMVLTGFLVAGWFLLLRLRARPLRWREALSRLYWRPWDRAEIRLLIAVLAGAFALSLLAQPLLVQLAARWRLSPNSLVVIIQSMSFHWVGLAAVVVLVRRQRLSWASAFSRPGARWGQEAGRGVLILLGVMPVLVLSALLFNLILQWFGFRGTLQDVAFIISDETSWPVRTYFFLLAVGLAPLFEEILFRGILLPALAKRFGAAASTVAISLLFAGIHGHIPSFVPLFILSMALSLAYVGTGSLIAPVVMHALFNGVTVTLLFVIR